ncbi:MAG: YHS domain-containing protein [Nitrospirae bacterium]|nr:YHS domain-containing protein [Nitrospirota bacterium]
MNGRGAFASLITHRASRSRGVIEPITALAIAGMIVMMGACIGMAVWGGGKMMQMMHGDHEKSGHESGKEHEPDSAAKKAVDPVCGMEVTVKEDTPQITLRGETYYFCSEDDMKKFAADPERYTGHEKK